jgi:hypothetical protein
MPLLETHFSQHNICYVSGRVMSLVPEDGVSCSCGLSRMSYSKDQSQMFKRIDKIGTSNDTRQVNQNITRQIDQKLWL